MSFFNALRESAADDRSVGTHRPLQGEVTNAKDPMGLQRIQVRIHDLHDDIADEDLPWFPPNQLAAYSGSANIGDHGPIPQKGAKIWVHFNDKSQYHGTYGGGVSVATNKVPEFANQNSTKTPLPDGSQYDFGQNYPWSNGGVDSRGSIYARDEYTDLHTDTHVSATGTAVDGKGNVASVINGDAPRPDNPNAKKQFPTGGNFLIFGNLTLYVSGNINVSASGNTNITTQGTTKIQSQGQLEILNNDELDVMSNSSSKTLYISSNFAIALQAPSITSSVPITIGPGKPPITPDSVTAKSAPSPRQRPNLPFTANDETY